MAKDKYELYRVPIREINVYPFVWGDQAALFSKYILNDISAEEIVQVIVAVDEFKKEAQRELSSLIVIDNMTTEEIACLYVALFSLKESHYYYKAPYTHKAISMLLDKEIINKLIKHLYILRAFRTEVQSSEVTEMVEAYPILGPKKKLDWQTENARFLVFADLWSRATHQVMSLEMFNMLEKKRG